MIVRHKITGEAFTVVPQKARIRRCQKRVKAWADVTESLRGSNRLVMLTLTYREVDDWEPGHIRSFMLDLRSLLKSRLLAYAWVAEMQKRGAVHYHVLLLVKHGTSIPKPDEEGLWVHGSTRIETARSPFYVLTYTGKEYQKTGTYPKHLRMYAVWVSPDILPALTRWLFRVSVLPSWLYARLGEVPAGSNFKRQPGGGWLLAGQVFQSPYEVLFFG